MKGLYNIACVMLAMVPMLSFIAAAVAFVMHGHPCFGAASMALAMLTSPKISIGGEDAKEGNVGENGKGGVKHGRTDRND